MPTPKSVDVVVRGQVQGVGFRDGVRRSATRHDVAGWVRNDPDGSVAAHFEGQPEAVDALVAWCRTGPRGGSVDRLDVRDAEPTGSPGFEVRF